jgi:hypothetical protein
MKTPWRSIRWITALGLLGVAAAFAIPRTAPAPAPAASAPTATAPTAPAPTAPALPAVTAPTAPAVPQDAAPIRDDPTVAPDSQESADNAVTYPSDI